MKNSFIIAALLLLTISGCSVGSKVNLKAENLNYPVSQSSSIYLPNGEFINQDNYELITDFSYNFRKWGISTVNIQSTEDISDQLNSIIQEKGGDGIVNLDISMRNTGTNSMMVFVKSVALIGSVIATAVTFSQPSAESTAFAGGSILTYIFTPANVDIEISGTVVKFIE
jgi:hypothetical protein